MIFLEPSRGVCAVLYGSVRGVVCAERALGYIVFCCAWYCVCCVVRYRMVLLDDVYCVLCIVCRVLFVWCVCCVVCVLCIVCRLLCRMLCVCCVCVLCAVCCVLCVV